VGNFGPRPNYPRPTYQELNPAMPLSQLMSSNSILTGNNDYNRMPSGPAVFSTPLRSPMQPNSPFPSFGNSQMGQMPTNIMQSRLPSFHPIVANPSSMTNGGHNQPIGPGHNPAHHRTISAESYLDNKMATQQPIGQYSPERNNPPSPPYGDSKPESVSQPNLNNSNLNAPPCRYFANGYCSRGERCNFSHVLSQPALSDDVNKPNNAFRTNPAVQRPNGRRARPVGMQPADTPVKNTIDVSRLHSVEQVVGQIYRICKDQHGCRFLQKKLEEKDKSPHYVELIFDEVYDHMVELMTDPFGNYLCQKLIEHCNEQQQLLIIQKVAPHLVKISKNMHGTRAVQKMIECLQTNAQVQLVVNSLRSSVVPLIQDLNGNHVIQRCLHKLQNPHNQFVYDAVAEHCVEVATHRHGCCVMQRCIDYATQEQKLQLVREIACHALTLVQDPFGNYVVQYVLELPFSLVKIGLIKKFCGHLSVLSTQKFSSNVIEKCLHVAEESVKEQLIDELMSPPTLNVLLQDPYGNYVIQTALTVAHAEQRGRLTECIKPLLPALSNTPYGKRIQNKIAKDCVEE